MKSLDFLDTLAAGRCPETLPAPLCALWHAHNEDWERAHRIVQALDDPLAARIHAYLHRVEGDEANARYWYARAGVRFPAGRTLDEEWRALVALASD